MENYTVSYFENIKRQKTKDIAINEVFHLILTGHFQNKIELLRQTTDQKEKDKIKQQLPAITVSGTFKKGHSEKDFLQHSGLIQIDFDNVPDTKQLMNLLRNDNFTFCAFISPTATGVKAIVKINPGQHKDTFIQLQNYYLAKYNLTIDAKCKDISRLMFLSYDNDIFVNENSILFNYTNPDAEKNNTHFNYNSQDSKKNNTHLNTTIQDVEKIITEIENKRLDITNPYENWLNIGFAFAYTFKDTGRDLFHRVSIFYPDYNKENCNKQFDECLKSRKEGITLKTFFHIAKGFGIKIKRGNNNNALPTKKGVHETDQTGETSKNETSKFFIVEKYLNEKFDFRYNEVANEIEHRKKGNHDYELLNENNLYRNLQLNNIHFSQNNLTSLLRSDFVNSFNPFTEYFESLPIWDGKTDPILNLCNYIKAKDQERFNRQFKKALVRCVACALGQCFNKHALILVGKQSNGKTTFVRWLCPPKLKNYYTENISTDKDSFISLSENFLINLDELAAFQKFERSVLKTMLSKDLVKIRKPYDKKPTTSKRRANFFGSTNNEEFLTDETGSVRWLCFEILEINWSYENEISINDVWAQAHTLFKQGFKCELTPNEIDENENANANYQHSSLEMELIQKHYVPAKKGEENAEANTATGVLSKLKEKNPMITNTLSVQNIGKALKLLGFEKVSERLDNSKIPLKVYWVRLVS